MKPYGESTQPLNTCGHDRGKCGVCAWFTSKRGTRHLRVRKAARKRARRYARMQCVTATEVQP